MLMNGTSMRKLSSIYPHVSAIALSEMSGKLDSGSRYASALKADAGNEAHS